MELLIERIRKREARIGIIGLGYVGLPLLLHFGEKGFRVIGFDIDRQKVESLQGGKSYIKHVPSERVVALVDGGKLSVTTDFDRLTDPDCILICVPTPLTPQREPDMRYIINTAKSICKTLRPGQLVVLESTSYPGTTEELLLPLFEQKGFRVGEDFFLAFSPEREDPGNPKYNTGNIPKIVGGVTKKCLEVASELYGAITNQVVAVRSPKVAEFAKLLENIYRSVNIALVNEMKILAHKMGIDIWEVIDAAATKPFGFTPFYPGPGLGGHCIPIDPFYLAWKAREYNFTARFIELAGEINVSMPHYVLDRITEALNQRGKCLKNSSVLILGIAYKKDVDDDRESPAYPIMQILMNRGARVSYNDPHIPALRPTRKYHFRMKSTPLDKKTLRSFDAVVIITDHSAYDYRWIVENSQLIVDTRNATRGLDRYSYKIVKA
ncbi:MAG: nucleotide sugar dehydrogenase [Deltaproteobacteria bacterium]|nr:nucleotide sugar dehydrogenase [Deltaproteobacteria bacterium]MBW2067496.1 nucleotide sugar dehydrogenase [Deltaproteobacteria bacterium]